MRRAGARGADPSPRREATAARGGAALLALLAAALAAPAAGGGGPAGPALSFERDGGPVRRLDRAALESACGAAVVRVPRDPYYRTEKRYLAADLRCVLAQGFGAAPPPDGGATYLFRARDGYVRPATPARVAEPGGYLAFADLEADGGFLPIDRRQLDPGPFYVVWSGPQQGDAHRYPWPYQLAAVEIVSFERRFPHTVPLGSPPDSPARRGFEIFRDECLACHAVNGEGGRVGPELNVPRSIVEYRPVEQLKAFIRDPRSFRYTTMPANRHLSEADLEALIAYFRAMSRLKRDPGPAG